MLSSVASRANNNVDVPGVAACVCVCVGYGICGVKVCLSVACLVCSQLVVTVLGNVAHPRQSLIAALFDDL